MITHLLTRPGLRRIPLLLLFAWGLIFGPSSAQAQRVEIETRTVATDLFTPWEITWGPDNWLWVAERAGYISRINPETGERHVLLTRRVFDHQESGMYGVVHHPNFADSPYVFINFSYQIQDPNGWTYHQRLSRYRYDAVEDTLLDEFVLIDSIPSSYFHNGGRMMMLPDRTLLLSCGDQANGTEVSQSHDSIKGKIIRMDLEGKAPPDNPFPTYKYPLSLIYSTGHRNPEGLVRLADGRIYSSEHGASSNDEVNLIIKGGNYGWPLVEGFCDNFTLDREEKFCADSVVQEPVYAFYNGWEMTVAPADLDYYDGPFTPWKGSLLVATLKNALIQLRLDPTGTRIVEMNRYFGNALNHRQFGRLRAMCISPDGRIFIGTSNQDGRAPSGFPVEGDDRIMELLPKTAGRPYLNAQPIDAWEGCAGGHFDAEIEIGGPFGPGNSFILELSDINGDFNGGERIVDTLKNPPDQLFYKVPIPADIASGTSYRLRLISTDPPMISEPSIDKITVLTSPATPVITREGDEMVGPQADYYQWYTEDLAPLQWGTGQRYTPQVPGIYYLQVFNMLGCGTLSGPFEYKDKTDTSTNAVREASTKDRFVITVRKDEVIIEPSLSGGATSDVKIELTDIAGRLVYSERYDRNARKAIVPLANLPSGMYAMRVTAGNEVITRIIPVTR